MLLVDELTGFIKILVGLIGLGIIVLMLVIPLNIFLPPFFQSWVPTYLQDISLMEYLLSHSRLIFLFLSLTGLVTIIIAVYNQR